MCGIQEDVRKISLLRSVAMVVCIAFHVIHFALVWVESDLEPFTDVQKKRSLAEIVDIGSYFIWIGTTPSFFVRAQFHSDTFEPLLRRSGRKVNDFAVLILGTMIVVATSFQRIAQADDHGIILISRIFDSLSVLIYLPTIMLTIDIIYGLQEEQACIRHLLKEPGINWQRIMSNKWCLRARTKRANGFLRVTIAAYGMQIFVWSFTIAGKFITEHFTALDAAVLAAYPISFVFQLIKVVMEGSNLIDGCREGERRLLVSLQNARVHRNLLVRMLPVVRYSEDWDALHFGFSPMKGSNFASFLVTCFTCTAVVLQFDYVVVRTMNQLSRSSWNV